jgi:hypothetical protein
MARYLAAHRAGARAVMARTLLTFAVSLDIGGGRAGRISGSVHSSFARRDLWPCCSRPPAENLSSEMADTMLRRRVSWIAAWLAAAQVLVGVGVSLLPNPEGWVGGIFYAGMYALPLLLMAVALRSSRRPWHIVAGWGALLLAVFYSLVVVGNWSGYSAAQAAFALALTAPTVLVDLLVFWATILRLLRPASRSRAAS